MHASHFQVDWRTSQPIDTNLDIVDSPTLDLPVGSLKGGESYNFSVTVLIEKEHLEFEKSVANIVLDVESNGVMAAITPSEMTVSQNRKIKLSGILSNDLDNSHRQMQVCNFNEEKQLSSKKKENSDLFFPFFSFLGHANCKVEEVV